MIKLEVHTRTWFKEYSKTAQQHCKDFEIVNKSTMVITFKDKEEILSLPKCSGLRDDILDYLSRNSDGFEEFTSVAYIPYSEITWAES